MSDKRLLTAQKLAQKFYPIYDKLSILPGEVDYNFCLTDKAGNMYSMKLSRPQTDRSWIELQLHMLAFLTEKNFPLQLPQIVATTGGQEVVELEDGQFLRLHRWVDGQMVDQVPYRSKKLLRSWGRCCGLLSKYLQGFNHPAAHRYLKWNPGATLDMRQHRALFTDPEQAAIADYSWQLFEEQALPLLPELPKSVCYHDAHEHNLLVAAGQEEITGLIDFGDVLYTETVSELAIAIAYASMHMPDPLEAAAQLVSAYHAVFPLREKEIQVLYPLMLGRLMITVTNSALQRQLEPENDYLQISDQPAWEVLRKWRKLSPQLVHYTFRHACGLPPCPQRSRFDNWLNEHRHQLAPVVEMSNKKITTLDLRVGSTALGNNANFADIRAFQHTIDEMMDEAGADIGLGGYCETRPFYSTDAYEVTGNNGARWRTVHLGMDVWAPAGTPVFAPWPGHIHSFNNNAAERDYGPAIIVEHPIDDTLSFYTLYGHLTLDSLDGLYEGMPVVKGQEVARIGPAPENGNWPPHLHYQLILDMLGKRGDFPGVAFPEEIDVWRSFVPDPTPFFPQDAYPKPYKSKEKILQQRKEQLGKSLSVSYQQPLHMVRGYLQHLYDTTGRRYLDTVNNVAHVGHEHPRVVRAGQRQMGLLNTNTRYLHENLLDFAEALLATLPPELCVVHFVNSGSEANELALRMAHTWSGQRDMLAVELGYHGNTVGTVDVSSYKFDGKGGKGAPATTHLLPMPDAYRQQDLESKLQDALTNTLGKVQAEGRNIAGFISESILSCGGQIVLPEGYLKEVYRQVRQSGGLCIADEVQTGFGRVGSHFWAFELQGVIPDIVTMGKPIGNGHPLGAVVTTRAVADAFANGMEYFNTFGGNPVSCAIGQEVLAVVQDEKLQDNALQTGTYLLEELSKLQAAFPIIGDVRGHGLFSGFELVSNPETKEPAAAAATYLANRMRERAILMSTDGPFHNVLKIKPPLCFGRRHADFLLENLREVLPELGRYFFP